MHLIKKGPCNGGQMLQKLGEFVIVIDNCYEEMSSTKHSLQRSLNVQHFAPF